MSKLFAKQINNAIAIAIIVGLWLIAEITSRIFAEILWFQEIDYLSALIIRWQSQYGLWVLMSTISILFLWGNLWWTNPKNQGLRGGVPDLPQNQNYLKSNKRQLVKKKFDSSLAVEGTTTKKSHAPKLNLPLLLTVAILGSVAVAIILIHYGNTALSVWQSSYRLPRIATTFRPPLDISIFTSTSKFLLGYLRQLSIIIVVVVFILLKPQTSLKAIAIVFGLILGSIWAGRWQLFLKFFQPTTFNYFDPQFHQDISFYMFKLPLWESIESWLLGITGYALISCFLLYLLAGNSLSEGFFPGFSRPQLRHLSFLGALLMLSLGIQHWLNRYELLYSSRGVVYGAGYTNVKVQLPVEVSLTIVSIVTAGWLLFKCLFGYTNLVSKRRRNLRLLLLILPFIFYLLVVLFGNLFSVGIQRFVVQPNELVTELPYIERSIALTRQAFNLDAIEARTFNPQGALTAQNIVNNSQTIDNIRLWDTRPILQTNRQLQRIRTYYQFADADIDRYILKTSDHSTADTKKQQVIIAARELDYSEVFDIAKTWVNEHLVYTHGYGFTLSPVNQVGPGGLPYYYVKDIGTGTEEVGGLTVSSEEIRQSIPIGKPRIYYGELTNSYVMTSTKVQELDYPSGEENVYNVYDGSGGIAIKNYLRRFLFANYLKDWQMLFAQNFTPETKLLFRRNIKERIKAIAPFLNYDRDPYLVVADIGDGNDNYLYWIIDAYTTSDRYPYSDPGENRFNYLRNSVKVVVDAYNGKVDFYIADPDDPIVQTWDKVFPQLLKPLAAMPESLRRHIRYPEDLFSTQSERLLTYHMTDPQVFYNREDQWQIPQEIYGTEARSVRPYYLIMKLPTATEEEFILLHPFTPISRPNLIAWLAARSDGEEYGNLLLYKFPKQRLVYGPNQVEALINQDPVISQQISLWNREGSRAVQGNLLIIPIEQSLLYVEPLYIEAERNSLPTLARVIVVYENKIVMAETLDGALSAIFTPQASPSEAIIRPVEEAAPVLPEAID
ncbi:MAG: UPF0182 family protein [Pleurocapsa sp.]